MCIHREIMLCNFPHYAHKNTPWDQWIVTTIHAWESSHQLIMPGKALGMGGHSLNLDLPSISWNGLALILGMPPHHHLGLTYHQKENAPKEENNDKIAIHPCLVKWEKRTDLGYLIHHQKLSHHTYEVCFHESSVHRKLVCNSIHKSGDVFVIPLGKQSIDLENKTKLSSFCTSSGDSFVGLCIPRQGYCV